MTINSDNRMLFHITDKAAVRNNSVQNCQSASQPTAKATYRHTISKNQGVKYMCTAHVTAVCVSKRFNSSNFSTRAVLTHMDETREIGKQGAPGVASSHVRDTYVCEHACVLLKALLLFKMIQGHARGAHTPLETGWDPVQYQNIRQR